MNVATWADQQLNTFGDFTALVDPQGALGAAELHQGSCRLAGSLKNRRLEPGGRVLLVFPNGRELVLAFTAVLRAGGVAVVLSPETPAEELSSIASELKADLELGVHPTAEIGLEGLRQAALEGPTLTAPVEREPGDLAQIVYSSGTTGRAKAIQWTHGMVSKRYEPFRDRRPRTAPARRNLGLLPMSSAFGAQYLYLRLLQKMELHCLAPFQPAEVLEYIERARIQTAMLVPSICEALLAQERTRPLTSLKSVLVGGSQVSPSLVKRFRERFGVRLTTVYGTTELGPVTVSEPGQTEGVVGKVREGLELRIVGPRGAALEPDRMGEIQVRSSGDEVWHSTGDLGRLSAEGELSVHGRLSDRIIRGGHNIDPGRLEEVILSCPGVRECAVVGVPEPLLGEEVVAWIVGGEPEQVKQWCRSRLEPALQPTRYLTRETLPRNSLGKVNREELRQESRRREAPEPAVLHEWLEREGGFLGGDSHQGFQERGLDSVALVELAARLSEFLGKEVAATTLFRYPTTDALVRFLCGQSVRHSSQRGQGDEPIAIIGMSVRLPGVDDLDSFWQALLEGRDFSAPIRRWRLPSTCPQRATLFDPPYRPEGRFFGLTAAEEEELEPTHGLALELCWQALESAGLLASQVPECGLFLGLSAGEVTPGHPLALPAMAVGRISHLLNLRGPAMAIDTTCSSGLVAIHTALNALLTNQCDVALAGGVHLLSGRDSFLGLSRLGVLAPDGRCKSFEASADGFGRGEGGATVLLKRLSLALRDGDPIQSVVRATATNHDGRSSSLTAPNGESQVRVIERALGSAGVPPELAYLEAHGTGTALGDPVEVESALEVLRGQRGRLVLGSVKANVGHLEAAAGAIGLVKAALVVGRGQIPPQPNFRRLNPALEPWKERFEIPLTIGSLDGDRVGVMSMGMSGTNAFALLEPPPARAESPPPLPAGDPYLLPLSAPNAQSLALLKSRFTARLEKPELDLPSLCATAALGRSHQGVRLAAVGRDREELLDSLQPGQGRLPRKLPTVAFLFTGQGVPWQGAGGELLDSEPVFRRALERCDKVLGGLGAGSVCSFVKKAESVPPAELQALLLSLQWALFELWRHRGVEPKVLAGHSLGEIAAATVAGLFTLEDALALVLTRGRLMEEMTRPGGLVALNLGQEEALELARGLDLELSAINGENSAVLGGLDGPLGELLQRAEAVGVKSRRLPVNRAFHTSAMEPLLVRFREGLEGVTFQPPVRPVISGLTGEVSPAEMSQPEYWVRQLRETVRFDRVLATLQKLESEVLLEVGTHPALLPLAAGLAPCAVPSLQEGESERYTLMKSLGELYQMGLTPRWETVVRSGPRLSLPVTPFCSPPTGAIESAFTLEEIVERTLGIPPSKQDPDRNLLDSGLDSLRLLQFVQQLQANLWADFTIATLMAAPTLRQLRDQNPVRGESLFTLRQGDPGIPTLAFPPAGGGVIGTLALGGRMEGAFHLFAFDRLGESKEAGVARCLSQLAGRESQPLRFLGWSAGAWMAFQAAAAWEGRGGAVDSVVMLDPPNPGQGPEDLWLESTLSYLLEHGGGGHDPTLLRQRLLQLQDRDFASLCEVGLVSLQDETGFEEHQQFYRYHLSLLPGQMPSALRAPVRMIWAGRAPSAEWEGLSGSGVSQKVVDSDHYSLIRNWAPD